MNEALKPVDFEISDSDLHTSLVAIDTQLRASNSKLFGRELRGWGLFCQKFDLTVAMSDPLAVRIFDWFARQYGDRLKGNLDFGNTLAEIRHDFYTLRLPRLYGSAIVHCDPTLPKSHFGPELTVNSGGVKTNLFDYLFGNRLYSRYHQRRALFPLRIEGFHSLIGHPPAVGLASP
jgi:hypothetical protein